MQPAILFIDEVEKGLRGLPLPDSPTAVFPHACWERLLSWLNDHTSDVFVVCTANDISKLPPEFVRAERFDALFFLDLPGMTRSRPSGSLYRELFGLSSDQRLPDDRHWTGSEIRACCRLASAAGCAVNQGRRKRGSRGGHRRRIGGASQTLGQQTLSVCRTARSF